MMKWTLPDGGIDKIDGDLDFRLFYFNVKELFQKVAELQELLSWEGDSLSLYEEVERRERGQARWRRERRREMKEAVKGNNLRWKEKGERPERGKDHDGEDGENTGNGKETVSESTAPPETDSESDFASHFKARYDADFKEFSHHQSELRLLQQLKRASFLGCAASQSLDMRCQWTCYPNQGCDVMVKNANLHGRDHRDGEGAAFQKPEKPEQSNDSNTKDSNTNQFSPVIAITMDIDSARLVYGPVRDPPYGADPGGKAWKQTIGESGKRLARPSILRGLILREIIMMIRIGIQF